jgi:allantoate deiminase
VLAAPGLYNVVAGQAELGLEVRHETAAKLDALEQSLLEGCERIAARRGLELAHELVAEQAPTALSPALARKAQSLASDLGLKHRVMTSGAAHDTMEFARAGVPALMIFVPSRDGISHSPEEFTTPEELDAGVRFASALLARISASIATDGAA